MRTPKVLFTRGVTFVEIVIVIAILAILALFIAPRMSGLVPFANDRAAITRAEAINGAMFTYRQRIAGAQGTWTAAGNNAARYVLLYNAGYLPNAAGTLAGFQPTGYTFALPATLTGRVTITGPNGAISY